MTAHKHVLASTAGHEHFVMSTDTISNTFGNNPTAYNYLALGRGRNGNNSQNYEAGGTETVATVGRSSASSAYTPTMENAGGNVAHENRMPYQVINRWIRNN